MNNSKNFYENLSSVYHLIFESWDASIQQQGTVLAEMLPPPALVGTILDCACGIGTQTFALANLGYKIEGVDLSPSAIERAKMEAVDRGFSINFRVDDMRLLTSAPKNSYDVIISMDNSLPHLNSNEDVLAALTAMHNCLNSEGLLLLGLRDYGKLMVERPNITEPKFFQDDSYRRIVHQVWDWQDKRRYVVHLYITYETKEGWKSHHSVGHYRAISTDEVVSLATQAGFTDVRILEPNETGYYQPIVRGKKGID